MITTVLRTCYMNWCWWCKFSPPTHCMKIEHRFWSCSQGVFLTDHSDRLRKVCSLSAGGGNSYSSCDSRKFLGGFADV